MKLYFKTLCACLVLVMHAGNVAAKDMRDSQTSPTAQNAASYDSQQVNRKTVDNEYNREVSSEKRDFLTSSTVQSAEKYDSQKETYQMTDDEFDQWIQAAKENDISTIEKFIKKGINVDEIRENSSTALYYAVTKDNLNTVKRLIDAGADVNYPCKTTVSILSAAAICVGMGKSQGLDILKILLDKKADPNERDEKGRTPLMYMILGGNTWKNALAMNMAASAMVKHGANVNLEDSEGRTALDYTETEFETAEPHFTEYLKFVLRAKHGRGYKKIQRFP